MWVTKIEQVTGKAKLATPADHPTYFIIVTLDSPVMTYQGRVRVVGYLRTDATYGEYKHAGIEQAYKDMGRATVERILDGEEVEVTIPIEYKIWEGQAHYA